jgi:hypothetical protein
MKNRSVKLLLASLAMLHLPLHAAVGQKLENLANKAETASVALAAVDYVSRCAGLTYGMNQNSYDDLALMLRTPVEYTAMLAGAAVEADRGLLATSLGLFAALEDAIDAESLKEQGLVIAGNVVEVVLFNKINAWAKQQYADSPTQRRLIRVASIIFLALSIEAMVAATHNRMAAVGIINPALRNTGKVYREKIVPALMRLSAEYIGHGIVQADLSIKQATIAEGLA